MTQLAKQRKNLAYARLIELDPTAQDVECRFSPEGNLVTPYRTNYLIWDPPGTGCGLPLQLLKATDSLASL